MAAGYLRQDNSSVLITRVVAGHCYQVVNRRGTENDNLDEVILVDGKDVPTLLCGRSLAEGHLDFSKIERKERRKIHDAIIMDNELRRHLVDRIPVGAKLVAISDTCNSGTLFDLDFHWQDDERCHCRMKTLIRPRIKPWAERWKRRSLDLFRPRKQLPMKRTATDVERREEMIPSMDESSSSRSNRSPPDAQDESDKSNASLFGELPRCSSPPPGELPEIMSLASSHDGETTYPSKDSMTMVFIDIIERLKGPIVTRTLVQELNNKMKQLRCDWMNMYWKTLAETQIVNKNIVDKKLQIIRCIQQPVIGSLSRKAPEKIFEL
ncbi:hypothetical protein BC629DRAFT_1523299 [Irpex lacteus]|nr:hypothetical protein BC629DRAFT_1523299 [Irpex lacteus]